MGCTSSMPSKDKPRNRGGDRSFEDILATEDTAIEDNQPAAVGDSQFTPEFGGATPGFGQEETVHRSGTTRIFVH